MPPKVNLKSFFFIKDECTSLITTLHDQNAEFETLAEKASSFDKEDLQNALSKLEQNFENLKTEYSSFVNITTKAQTTTCEDSIGEIRNKITSLKKDIKINLRNFESLTTNSGNGNLQFQSPTTIFKSNKVNKSFEPKQLKFSANFSTYTQWRGDWCLHGNINKFYKEDIPTQRAHLVQLLDTELRATLDSEAPHQDTTPIWPPLSEEQLSSFEQGKSYPVPAFPAPTSCLIGLLDLHYNRKEPKMMRLYNYNKACLDGQLQNEGWYEAWTRLDQMYQRSGIDSMSKEEYRKMTCIIMTRDSTLRQKLLQQGEEKSLQDLLAIGQAWQVSSSLSSKIEQKNNAFAAKTSSFKKLKRHRDDQMWLFKDLMNKKGLCYRCNSPNCKRGTSCFAEGKTCTECGGPNHFASVCQMDSPWENKWEAKKAKFGENTKKNIHQRLGPRINETNENKYKWSATNKDKNKQRES